MNTGKEELAKNQVTTVKEILKFAEPQRFIFEQAIWDKAVKYRLRKQRISFIHKAALIYKENNKVLDTSLFSSLPTTLLDVIF